MSSWSMSSPIPCRRRIRGTMRPWSGHVPGHHHRHDHCLNESPKCSALSVARSARPFAEPAHHRQCRDQCRDLQVFQDKWQMEQCRRFPHIIPLIIRNKPGRTFSSTSHGRLTASAGCSRTISIHRGCGRPNSQALLSQCSHSRSADPMFLRTTGLIQLIRAGRLHLFAPSIRPSRPALNLRQPHRLAAVSRPQSLRRRYKTS